MSGWLMAAWVETRSKHSLSVAIRPVAWPREEIDPANVSIVEDCGGELVLLEWILVATRSMCWAPGERKYRTVLRK